MSKQMQTRATLLVFGLIVAGTLVGVAFYGEGHTTFAGTRDTSNPKPSGDTNGGEDGSDDSSDGDGSIDPPDGGGSAPIAPLLIGPIEGLTTEWHAAPPQASVPVGLTLTFIQERPFGGTVTWTGAEFVGSDGAASMARCPLHAIGPVTITAEVVRLDGRRTIRECQLDVVDVGIADISVGPITPPFESILGLVDPPNSLTMKLYFGASIAALRQRGEGWYSTSVYRPITLSVEVDPPGFAPLMEWRFDGVVETDLGPSSVRAFTNSAPHIISVGPPGNAQEIQIDTYSVTITSRQGIIPEGEAVTFEAATDPPGLRG